MFRTHIHTWLATQCWAITLTTELLLGVPCFSWSAGFPQPLDQTFSRSCDSDGNIIRVIVTVDGVHCGRITCGVHGFHGHTATHTWAAVVCHLLLSTCAYIPTERKYVPSNKVCLILNNMPLIGNTLHLDYCFFHYIGSENGRVSGRRLNYKS